MNDYEHPYPDMQEDDYNALCHAQQQEEQQQLEDEQENGLPF